MYESKGKKILEFKRRIVEDFTHGDWEELGLLTDCTDIIDGHGRLKRSLFFGDEDYSGNVIAVLRQMANRNPDVIPVIDEYLNGRYPDKNVTYISTKPSERKITFSPNAFEVPSLEQEDDLIAVMMPFSAEFRPVYKAIQEGCRNSGFRCLRADDIWEESTIMQDIFNLIFRAKSIIVDFSGKNPNVMYETGIAHTLGKTVIPITQNISDIPSDMGHHRALRYLLNAEGLGELSSKLTAKLRSICA
jgi:hypothetical protein